MVNAAALVRLPAGKRPKALVWTDERVQRWGAAVERLEAVEADDPAREQLEAAAQPPITGDGVDAGAARDVPRCRRR